MAPHHVASDGNLDARAQAMQLRVGVTFITLGLAVAVVLAHATSHASWRALAFLPLFFGAYGVLAALHKTCGFTAIAGRRIGADGSEVVADPTELSALRRRGIKIIGASVALSGVASALLVLAR